jgi:dihydroneopterin aldolase
MADRILVSAIECVSAIGVSTPERSLGNRLSIDVEVSTDTRGAAASDSIEDAVDYSEIVALVARLAGDGEYHLIEALAERIATAVLEDFGVREVRVAVRKQPPPMAAPVGSVGVDIFRTVAD